MGGSVSAILWVINKQDQDGVHTTWGAYNMLCRAWYPTLLNPHQAVERSRGPREPESPQKEGGSKPVLAGVAEKPMPTRAGGLISP